MHAARAVCSCKCSLGLILHITEDGMTGTVQASHPTAGARTALDAKCDACWLARVVPLAFVVREEAVLWNSRGPSQVEERPPEVA